MKTQFVKFSFVLAILFAFVACDQAEDLGVAQRLIASASELEDLAQGLRDGVKALDGWRNEAFGADALRLINGEIALSAGPNGVRVVETSNL